MTPAARTSAAIALLDNYLAGSPVEKSLTNWARGNRYAGSSDRAAIRDMVYQAIRCRASYAHLGGALSGRALMIGQARATGSNLDELFSGARFAPAPLSAAERICAPLSEAPAHIQCDCPEWIWEMLGNFGPERIHILGAMQSRAPVFCRVNLIKSDVPDAIAALAAGDMSARPHRLATTALEITGNARNIGQSQAFRDGLVELQDAASQATVEFLGLGEGMQVLDFCAGGGGKALGMAALTKCQVAAYDAAPARMRDLPVRAARAGADLRLAMSPHDIRGPFDLVLCDVPCSGSGSWHRDPAGKWTLSPDRLAALQKQQAQILRAAATFVRPGGVQAYSTCSLLRAECHDAVASFVGDHPDWTLMRQRQFTPRDGGDGFYVAVLTQSKTR